jgi:suppressor for copper-sensitivity B
VQNYLIIFLIFIAIGIGFAMPYLILLISPKLVYLLPKSGEWMFKTKQLMAGLLAATVIWLIFVVSGNIGFLPACLLAVLAAILFGCFKIKSEFLKYLAIIITITASFTLPMDFKKHQEASKQSYESMWREFDEAEIYRLVAQGKTVLVDVTADWCITCKFNKIRVLQDEEIIIRIKRGDVIAMRGDITKPNEEIMNFLRKNNRFAIPFNAVYGPSAPTGLLTSELLNKKELIELIEKAR